MRTVTWIWGAYLRGQWAYQSCPDANTSRLKRHAELHNGRSDTCGCDREGARKEEHLFSSLGDSSIRNPFKFVHLTVRKEKKAAKKLVLWNGFFFKNWEGWVAASNWTILGHLRCRNTITWPFKNLRRHKLLTKQPQKVLFGRFTSKGSTPAA